MGKLTDEKREAENRKDHRYWLYEEPEVYETARNAIRYYQEAGKLQFALPDYVEIVRQSVLGTPTEIRKPGRLCALDLTALYEDQETLAWLLNILEGLRLET